MSLEKNPGSLSVLRIGVMALPDPTGRRGPAPAPLPRLAPRGWVPTAAVPAPAPPTGRTVRRAPARIPAAGRGIRVMLTPAAVPCRLGALVDFPSVVPVGIEG